MPYRESLAPVIERTAELDAIVAANGKVVVFKSNNPEKLRWSLHEALHAARKLGIAPFCDLDVVIRFASPLVYIVQRKPALVVEVLDEANNAAPMPETFVQHLEANEFDVAAAVLTHPDKTTFTFLHYVGAIEDITHLADERGYAISFEEDRLVLAKVI